MPVYSIHCLWRRRCQEVFSTRTPGSLDMYKYSMFCLAVATLNQPSDHLHPVNIWYTPHIFLYITTTYSITLSKCTRKASPPSLLGSWLSLQLQQTSSSLLELRTKTLIQRRHPLSFSSTTPLAATMSHLSQSNGPFRVTTTPRTAVSPVMDAQDQRHLKTGLLHDSRFMMTTAILSPWTTSTSVRGSIIFRSSQ